MAFFVALLCFGAGRVAACTVAAILPAFALRGPPPLSGGALIHQCMSPPRD